MAAASCSPAGWWFVYVSNPVAQFILLRWYFRLFVWMRFLWQVARCELSLAGRTRIGLGAWGAVGACRERRPRQPGPYPSYAHHPHRPSAATMAVSEHDLQQPLQQLFQRHHGEEQRGDRHQGDHRERSTVSRVKGTVRMLRTIS